jgi:hypothetical protein
MHLSIVLNLSESKTLNDFLISRHQSSDGSRRVGQWRLTGFACIVETLFVI